MRNFFALAFISAMVVFGTAVSGYSQDIKDVAGKVADKTKDAGKTVVKGTKKAADKTKDGAVEVADKAEDVGDKTVSGAKRVAGPTRQVGTHIGNRVWTGTKWVSAKSWKGGKWVAENSESGVKWVYKESKDAVKDTKDAID